MSAFVGDTAVPEVYGAVCESAVSDVNTTIVSDWFTFFIALIFANLLFFLLVNNFSDVTISYMKIGYNTFFTLFLFPILWLLFSLYQANFIGGQDA